MDKEETLSDKIYKLTNFQPLNTEVVFVKDFEEAIKNFIHDLKYPDEKDLDLTIENLNNHIDRLKIKYFGERLVKE